MLEFGIVTLTLQIYADGSGGYEKVDGNVSSYINGRVKIKGDELKVTAGIANKKWKIVTEPTLDEGGDLYMTLDDEYFYKSY